MSYPANIPTGLLTDVRATQPGSSGSVCGKREAHHPLFRRAKASSQLYPSIISSVLLSFRVCHVVKTRVLQNYVAQQNTIKGWEELTE